jgi:hypothetical protein
MHLARSPTSSPMRRQAPTGKRFRRLYDACCLDAYGGDHSRADLALCGMLAFWTNDDPTGEADRKVTVVGVRKANAGCFDQEAQFLRVGRLDLRRRADFLAEQSGCFVQRQDRLARGAVREAHAALET